MFGHGLWEGHEKGNGWEHLGVMGRATVFESLSSFIHLSLAMTPNFRFFICKNGDNSMPVLPVLQAYCEACRKEASMTVSADAHYCC